MSTFDIDEESVRKLADLLKETGLNEIEYAEGEKRIRVSAGMPVAPSNMPAAEMPAAGTLAAHAPGAPLILNGTPVEAPMVGTVYLAPEPGAAPFVKTGDTIKAGDTLLIIEAMKVMNPIKAPVGGTVKEILVGDAKPVEFGETLMVIG
ncbi:MAG: acetyl-CoA carboxylase biotin carboxyl carrier protein [Alphaproteobacteria bacterium]|nr:acetyl-CoA carboxylase biotin carboxyl carrier protein [Alphaproteobacteria bacterium]